MASIEDRMNALAKRHLNLDHDLDLDAGLTDSEVSSADAVMFIKRCGEEFDVVMPPETVAGFKNLRDVASYIDSHTG